MKWVEVQCLIPNESSEAFGEVILGWPEVQGIAVEGVGDAKPPHAEFGEWYDDSLLETAVVTVRFYLPEPATPESTARRTLAALDAIADTGLPIGDAAQDLRCDLIDESSWASAWQEDYNPMLIGEQLIIVPQWDVAELAQANFHGRLAIVLEPGQAFGTGTHQTTQLCLEALERFVEPNSRVLDVGTGTAILAIAAARLGALHVDAIDIDPVAVRVARDNVDDNQMADRVTVYEGNLLDELCPQPLPQGTYQLIVANILRDIVIALAPVAYERLCPGGRLVASGLVREQARAVSTAFAEAGLQVAEQVERDDWVLLVGEKVQ